MRRIAANFGQLLTLHTVTLSVWSWHWNFTILTGDFHDGSLNFRWVCLQRCRRFLAARRGPVDRRLTIDRIWGLPVWDYAPVIASLIQEQAIPITRTLRQQLAASTLVSSLCFYSHSALNVQFILCLIGLKLHFQCQFSFSSYIFSLLLYTEENSVYSMSLSHHFHAPCRNLWRDMFPQIRALSQNPGVMQQFFTSFLQQKIVPNTEHKNFSRWEERGQRFQRERIEQMDGGRCGWLAGLIKLGRI